MSKMAMSNWKRRVITRYPYRLWFIVPSLFSSVLLLGSEFGLGLILVVFRRSRFRRVHQNHVVLLLGFEFERGSVLVVFWHQNDV